MDPFGELARYLRDEMQRMQRQPQLELLRLPQSVLQRIAGFAGEGSETCRPLLRAEELALRLRTRSELGLGATEAPSRSRSRRLLGRCAATSLTDLCWQCPMPECDTSELRAIAWNQLRSAAGSKRSGSDNANRAFGLLRRVLAPSGRVQSSPLSCVSSDGTPALDASLVRQQDFCIAAVLASHLVAQLPQEEVLLLFASSLLQLVWGHLDALGDVASGLGPPRWYKPVNTVLVLRLCAEFCYQRSELWIHAWDAAVERHCAQHPPGPGVLQLPHLHSWRQRVADGRLECVPLRQLAQEDQAVAAAGDASALAEALRRFFFVATPSNGLGRGLWALSPSYMIRE